MIPLLIAAAALVGCNRQESEPTAPPAPPPPAASPLDGAWSATSNTAMGITGDLTVAPGALTFAKGQSLRTTPAAPVDATTYIAKGAPSFAETAVGPTSLAVELVQVGSASGASLCGDAPATYVALAYDTPPRTLKLLVFSGADAPGPDAVNTALCGTFMYDK